MPVACIEIMAARVIGLYMFAGILALIWQSIADFKTLKISPARNFVMLGIVVSLIYSSSYGFIYGVAGFVIAIIFGRALQKAGFGGGDKEGLRWAIPGFVLLGWIYAVIFIAVFCLLSIVTLASMTFFHSKKSIYSEEKQVKKAPGMPILLFAFAITSFLYLVGAGLLG